MTSTEAQLVSRKYEEMMGLLQGYCEKVYEEWASGAGRDCRFTLEQPLICRDPESSLLSVNFSREVGAGGPAWRRPTCSGSCSVQAALRPSGFYHKPCPRPPCLTARRCSAGGEVPELPAAEGHPGQRREPLRST